MKLTGENRSTRGKTCPSANLPTTNPTWKDPGSKPGLRGGRPATNRLSHGTAYPELNTTVLEPQGTVLVPRTRPSPSEKQTLNFCARRQQLSSGVECVYYAVRTAFYIAIIQVNLSLKVAC
jgi:hypothetical protein